MKLGSALPLERVKL